MDDTRKEASGFRFRKGERLRLRTLVEQLFDKGESHFEWPLRVVARRLDAEGLDAMFKGHVPPGTGRLQMLVTVPKRRRRKAVDRVAMRRRIREAYRLCRAPLREAVDADQGLRTFSVAFVYMADKNVDYARVERAMRRLIDKMARKHFPAAGEEGEGDGHGG